MSNEKQATWADYLSWCAVKLGDKLPARSLLWASEHVMTEREARMALYGFGAQYDVDTDLLLEDWTELLQEQGVLPPVDPPSVAKALDIVAGEIADAGETFCADLSGDEAQQVRLAFGCSVAIVRTLAKDFA